MTSALFPGTTARAVSVGPFDWLLVALDTVIGTRALAVRVLPRHWLCVVLDIVIGCLLIRQCDWMCCIRHYD